jgi:hypothetical protein
MWEPLCLILLSVYLVLENKIKLSALVFSISIFFRYLAIIYLPFFIILVFLRKKKIKNFVSNFSIASSLIFLIILLIFGYNFIDDTILFQVFSKMTYTQTPKLIYQYISLGFFTMFLALISAFLCYEKKDKTLLLFSFYPLIINLLILVSLKIVFYHYFLFAVPLVMIATSKTFLTSKYKILKPFLVTVVLLSLISNYVTIDFYLNPEFSKDFYSMADFIENNTLKNDNMFGPSAIIYYVSFTKDIPVTKTQSKSFLSYEVYLNERDVIENLDNEKPKFIIDDGLYSSNPHFSVYLQNKYELKKIVKGFENYFIYERL